MSVCECGLYLLNKGRKKEEKEEEEGKRIKKNNWNAAIKPDLDHSCLLLSLLGHMHTFTYTLTHLNTHTHNRCSKS